MTVLIAVYKSGGKDGKPQCIGRCDAKCYGAKHAGCDCICGGANHGTSLEKAIKNTRENQEEWIKQFSIKKQLKEFIGQVNPDIFQLSLLE